MPASYAVLPNTCEFNILHTLLVSISVSAVMNTDLMSLMLINRKLYVVSFTRKWPYLETIYHVI